MAEAVWFKIEYVEVLDDGLTHGETAIKTARFEDVLDAAQRLSDESGHPSRITSTAMNLVKVVYPTGRYPAVAVNN
jgi:hypothetical protein